MKKTGWLLLLISLQFNAFAGVELESRILDRTPEEKNDHYICLGKGWDKVHPQINRQLEDIKTVYPDLFKDLSQKEQNCFAPAEVPFGLQKSMDSLLKKIEEVSAGDLQVSVENNGALIPLNEHKIIDCPPEIGSLEVLNNEISEGFKLRNQDKTFGRKLLRAELLVGGVEAGGMGLLIALPKSITKWDEDWMDDAKRNLKRAWTQSPVWDKDDWAINYIGHPLAGAVYYNALRSQGGTRLQSFLFSTVQSTIWEYGVEAIAERPSIQDLFITPVVGSVIGELSHLATQRMAKRGFSFGEKVLVTIINPSYVLNNGFRGKK